MWRGEVNTALEIADVKEKASRLTSIIRRILNETGPNVGGQSSKLDSADGLFLREAAEHALEVDLSNLLKEVSALNISLDLVGAFITDRNSLARAVVDSENEINMKLNENLLIALRAKLETRGLLLNNGIDDVEWFDRLCNEYPTLAKLQSRKWSDIDEIMVNQPYLHSNAEEKVSELWCQNRPIRSAIIHYNLPHYVAEAFERKGIQDPTEITRSQIDELVKETNDLKIKAKVIRFWNEESAEGKNRNAEREEKRKNEKQRIEEAKKIISDLHKELSKTNNLDRGLVQQRFDNAAQKLNISSWQIDDINTMTMDRLRGDLRKIEDDLSKASADLDVRISSYRSDEELISSASAGLALYGIDFGMGAIPLGWKSARPILDQPDYCPIESSLRASVKEETVHFSTIDAGSNFRKTVESTGYTLASGLKASGWGFSSSREYGNAMETNRTETTAAAQVTNSVSIMSYKIFSVGSFRIPRSQMKLTVDAASDAKAITTQAHAKQFLKDYGSHVSDGVHHLGGIICRISEARSSTKHSFEVLKNIAIRKVSGDANVGYLNIIFNGDVSALTYSSNFTEVNTENKSASINAEIQTKVEIHGPSTTNTELFKRLLQANNQNWHVIDRSSFSSLVPIWTIFDDSDDPIIKQAAPLVRTAWIQQAKQFSYIPEIHQELQRAQIDKFSLATGNGLLSSQRQPADKSIIPQAKLLVQGISKTDLSKLTAEQVLRAVIELFANLSHFSYQSHTNVFLEMMRQSPLPAFIRTIATYQDQKKVSLTQKFVREIIFDKETQQYLDHANISLDNHIKQMLTRSPNSSLLNATSSGDIWDIPSIPLQQLPSYLTKMKSDIMDGSEMAEIGKLNLRLCDVLSKNIAEYGENNQIQTVLKRYGWEESAFSGTLTEEHVHSLIEALKMKLEENNQTQNLEQVTQSLNPINDDVKPNLPDEKLASYSKLIVDRPVISHPTDSIGNNWLIDVLRHRLAMKRNVDQEITNECDPNDFFDLTDNNNSVATTNMFTKSVFDILIDVVKKFNATGKIEIFRLLLERRSALPLLMCTSDNHLYYHGPLLDHVQVNFGKDSLKLGSDTNLCRIAVISNLSQDATETHSWLKDVFGIHSLYKIDGKPSLETTIGELGIGFLDSEPCLVLHVVGDWLPLQDFIKDFANWILIEGAGFKVTTPISTTAVTAVWDSSVKNSTSSRTEPYKHVLITGTRSSVLSTLQKALKKGIDTHKTNPNKISTTLHKIRVSSVIKFDEVNLIAIESSLRQTDFSKARQSFLLQSSFRTQADFELNLFSLHALNNPAQRAMLEQRIEIEESNRMKICPQIEQLDIIKLFISILKQPNSVTRTLSLQQFEKILSKKCQPYFCQRDDIEDLAWSKYENAQQQQRSSTNAHTNAEIQGRTTALAHYLKEWHQACIARNKSIIAPEHCWRELSHLFAANPRRYGKYPELASRALQDGFSLELMDGDAGMINIKWISAVLARLEKDLSTTMAGGRTYTPRIFVLSILGVQSCGKSTLLNLMFGIRLKTSVGACTRGVNMQLIKCEDRQEYDYILLLDTEGLRAPESVGLPNSHLRDNRMATLALLPADATIILNKGETDEAIKEILPVVVRAYLDSTLAEDNGGQLSTKIFFVYNQIDTTQVDLLGRIEKKLVVMLREESERVALEKQAEQQESTDHSHQLHFSRSQLNVALRDFQHNIHDKSKNDIRVLGYLKHDVTPPLDLPNTKYGIDIMELREHIHRRVTSLNFWKPRDLPTIANYIELVWGCIISSNFQLNFSTAVQRNAYTELEKRLSEIERALNGEYDMYFQHLEREINSFDPCSSITIESNLTDYCTKLEGHASAKLQELSLQVRQLLENHRWIQWQTEKLCSWNRIVEQQKNYWKGLLEEKLNGVLKFQRYINEYKNIIYERAKELFAGNTPDAIRRRAWTIQEKLKEFENLFRRQLDEARQEHRPSADQVQQKINDVYSRNSDIQTVFIIADKKKNDLRTHWNSVKAKVLLPGNTVKSAWTKLSGRATLSKDDEQLIVTLVNQVSRSLQNVEHYSDKLVQDAIEMTRTALKNERRKSIKENVNHMVHSLLTLRLTDIQKRWDENNCVSKRLEKEKEQLWSYFQNVGNNLESFALLSKTLCNMFQRHIPEAFIESLATYVRNTLYGKNWLTDAEILLAYTDLEIIEDLHQNQINHALDKCNNTFKASNITLHRLISKEVERFVVEHWEFFNDHIKASLNISLQKTLLVESNLAKKFLDELRKELAKLNTGILSNNIPSNPEHYTNCDTQKNDFQTLADEVMKALPSTCDGNWNVVPKCTKQILERLRDRTLNETVRLRCGSQCPLCHSPCMLGLGHTDEKHDTYHQPVGLAGCHLLNDNTLSSDTCAESIQKNHLFLHRGKQRSFTEFNNVFTDWKLPSIQMKLKLREYIFYHYHERIAELQNLKACKNVPCNFNHDLNTIEIELTSKLGGTL